MPLDTRLPLLGTQVFDAARQGRQDAITMRQQPIIDALLNSRLTQANQAVQQNQMELERAERVRNTEKLLAASSIADHLLTIEDPDKRQRAGHSIVGSLVRRGIFDEEDAAEFLLDDDSLKGIVAAGKAGLEPAGIKTVGTPSRIQMPDGSPGFAITLQRPGKAPEVVQLPLGEGTKFTDIIGETGEQRTGRQVGQTAAEAGIRTSQDVATAQALVPVNVDEARQLKEQALRIDQIASAPERIAAQDEVLRTMDGLFEEVGLAQDLVGSFTTGAVGQVLKNIPGTDAFALGQTISTIKARLTFDELMKMKASSPTGGALGSISERELTLLGDSLVALTQANDAPAVKRALSKVARHYGNWRDTVVKARDRELSRGSSFTSPDGVEFTVN